MPIGICMRPVEWFHFQSSCSSRMHVMNHNLSARKQRLYLQSVAEISCHSASSEDRIRQCGTSSGSRCNWTQIGVCKSPISSAGTALFLFHAKSFSRDHCCRGRSKPGCQIVGSHTRWELTTWANFQLCLHQLLMSTGCKSIHSGFLHVSRSNGGYQIHGYTWYQIYYM